MRAYRPTQLFGLIQNMNVTTMLFYGLTRPRCQRPITSRLQSDLIIDEHTTKIQGVQKEGTAIEWRRNLNKINSLMIRSRPMANKGLQRLTTSVDYIDHEQNRTIPVNLLLDYFETCVPLLAQVYDKMHEYDPLSERVMPFILAFLQFEQSLHQYQCSGHWAGPPLSLATRAADPIDEVQGSAQNDGPRLHPFWVTGGTA